MDIVIFLLIGATAGWIGGRIMEGGGFGLLGNMVVGVLGSYLGKYLAGVLGIGVEGGRDNIAPLFTFRHSRADPIPDFSSDGCLNPRDGFHPRGW
jgi:uncharacterized membrane protein YeaQ/YmgE (transglycosylase-associated protein family)